jgi:hypothetical protein
MPIVEHTWKEEPVEKETYCKGCGKTLGKKIVIDTPSTGEKKEEELCTYCFFLLTGY